MDSSIHTHGLNKPDMYLFSSDVMLKVHWEQEIETVVKVHYEDDRWVRNARD